MDIDRALPAAPPAAESSRDGHTAIVCHALGKRFGRHRAVVDLYLSVNAGEVVGYLGPNGAGKTTTLRLLTGALRPTAGSATVSGLDCWRSAPAVHRDLGYVPSEPALDLRVTGAVLLDLDASMRDVRATAARPAQYALADRLVLDLTRRVGELSRGNRQKLAVVLALWHRPRVLLLDEPTTGLDPLVQDTFRELLRDTAAAGAAVLLSSHALAEVERFAHRVVVLREGRVVANADVATLRHHAPHRVRVRFADPAAATVLDTVSGVADRRADGDEVTFSVRRHAIGDLVAALGRVRVTDLEIREAELEELFRSLYGGAP
ncbi:MAG: beta-exotoxin transport system ATP-binding protein [Actinomycetota bacterium]|nr:transporter [Cryptosporangiaceae bacterium]MDQ1677858.1 beta-exotoxin transport system ATP-binding protein [Actinomycetota bacterium]